MSLKLRFHLLKSSSFRFALLTGFTIWLATAVVLLAVYFKLENTIWHNIDRELDHQTNSLLARAAENPNIDADELVAAFNLMANTNATAHSSTMMAMHNTPEMLAMHSTMGIATPPSHFMNEGQTLTGDSGNLQFSRQVTLPNGQIITLSQNIEYLADLQTSLWQSLAFGLSITLLIALIAAIVLTQHSLRRIHQINHSCQTIIAGSFSHRIPYANSEGRYDDYDQMAFNINRMLDEINQLLTKVRQVSDNIAHDLKSPLARLRAQLESAYAETPSQAIDSGIQEVDRLLNMIKSLLGIGHIENRNKQTFEQVDMRALLQDVKEMYLPVFEDKHIRFQCHSTTATLFADRHLIIQALANLLDNALKFTPSGGTVRLHSTFDKDVGLTLVIHDSGNGIPEKSLKKVFERFHREDNARDALGFGLGLSLVEAIVKLHGGTITLHNDQGLVATILFPVERNTST